MHSNVQTWWFDIISPETFESNRTMQQQPHGIRMKNYILKTYETTCVYIYNYIYIIINYYIHVQYIHIHIELQWLVKLSVAIWVWRIWEYQAKCPWLNSCVRYMISMVNGQWLELLWPSISIGCCMELTRSISGFWFGTFFIVPYIGNVIIPTDFHSYFSEG